MRMAVAPKPATGPAAAIVPDGADGPSRARSRPAPASPAPSRRTRRGRPCRTRRRTRPRGVATTRAHAPSAAIPASVPSIPAPKCATRLAASIRDSVSSRTCPPSRAASLGVGGRRVAGHQQVRVAASHDHRERHAPDVAGRRRGGRVEVPVGIEPGDRQPGCPAVARRRPAIAPAWDVQSPPRRSSRASGPAAVSAPSTCVASRGRIGADQRPVLRARVGVRRPARVVRRVAGVHDASRAPARPSPGASR